MKKILLLLLLPFLLTACANQTPQTKEIFAMDTVMQLSATGKNASDALTAAVESINQADSLWSEQREGSDIYRLNQAKAGEKVDLDPETADILNKAVKYAALTNGAFDPTIAPISNLWGISGSNPHIPPDSEIQAKKALVGYKSLSLTGNAASFLKPGMQADLGGIGKGAVSDYVARIFNERGIKTALFSLGGNVGTIGLKPDGSKYKIGIRDPDGAETEYIGYVTVTDTFVVTSGDYERYFIQNSVRYHHIFDPSTGYPSHSGLRAVTIISDNGALADAYSTALFVMGLQKGLEFQKSQGSFEAIFITDDKKIVLTDGAKKYFTFTAGNRGYTYET